MTLQEKLLALHEALETAGLPHAFGGAIALAYATENPRGTTDIDVNVFVAAREAERALSVLPRDVAQPPDTASRIARDGQIRLWWEETPIDLFFDYDPIHVQAAANRRTVHFEGAEIPVLGPVELGVFKAMFNRTQDWADIEKMIAANALDVGVVKDSLRELLGSQDERFGRLDDAVRRGREQPR